MIHFSDIFISMQKKHYRTKMSLMRCNALTIIILFFCSMVCFLVHSDVVRADDCFDSYELSQEEINRYATFSICVVEDFNCIISHFTISDQGKIMILSNNYIHILNENNEYEYSLYSSDLNTRRAQIRSTDSTIQLFYTIDRIMITLTLQGDILSVKYIPDNIENNKKLTTQFKEMYSSRLRVNDTVYQVTQFGTKLIKLDENGDKNIVYESKSTLKKFFYQALCVVIVVTICWGMAMIHVKKQRNYSEK